MAWLQLESAGSLVGGAATLAVLLCALAVFHRQRGKRLVKLCGVSESLRVGFVLACMMSASVIAVVDQPFVPCGVFAGLVLAPQMVLFEMLVPYIHRFYRLYRRNMATGAAAATPAGASASASTASGESEEALGPKRRTSRLLAFCDDASFTAKTTTANLVFMLVALGLYVGYLASEFSNLYFVAPASFEECTAGKPLFAGLLAAFVADGVLLNLAMSGIHAQLRRNAFGGCDSLGVKRRLEHLLITAWLLTGASAGATVLVAANAVPVRYALALPAPFVAVLFWLIILVPVVGAVRDASFVAGNGLTHTNLEPRVAKLEKFLQTKQGYELVEAHLRAELGLETLHFITRATKYTEDFLAVRKAKSKPHRAQQSRTSLMLKGAFSSRNFFASDGTGAGTAVAPAVPVEDKAGLRGGVLGSGGGSDRGGDGGKNGDKNAPFAGETAEERMQRTCVNIFSDFISLKAENQINLPHRITKCFAALEEALEVGPVKSNVRTTKVVPFTTSDFKATPEIFDDAIRETMTMLFWDSFQRLLKKDPANKARWEAFLQEQEELKALHDVDEDDDDDDVNGDESAQPQVQGQVVGGDATDAKGDGDFLQLRLAEPVNAEENSDSSSDI